MNIRHNLPEKVRIARSFGNAAESYDRYAHLQRDIADKLLADLGFILASNILDLGSGTGYCGDHLGSRFPGAQVISLDIAEAMLRFAMEKGAAREDAWVCGDAEDLPFRDNAFDLVVSSLAMQWCPEPTMVFRELHRVMAPGAHAYISTLAQNTLGEIRDSWSQVDSYVHVNSFLPCHVITSAFASLAFSSKKIINSQEQYFYPSLNALSEELKGIGANNMNSGQASGLTGKSKLVKLKQLVEQNRVAGKGIPVTYDIVLIHLVK